MACLATLLTLYAWSCQLMCKERKKERKERKKERERERERERETERECVFLMLVDCPENPI